MTRIAGIALLTIVGAYCAYTYYSFKSSGKSEFGPEVYVAIAIMVIFSITSFFLMFVNKKSSEFAIEVESETKKITWPDWLTVKGHTWQVVIVMIFFMGYLFVVDIILGYVRGVIL
jgi:preprotein translocase SecE subunit